MDQASRRASFRALHERGCFVIPNPWDRGSAVALAKLGFPALATTSAGYAFSRGLPDATDVLAVDDVIAHVADIATATELPVNADFQSGYAPDPEGVAGNVSRCVGAGVAGLSIEDTREAPRGELFGLEEATERVVAARAAIDATGADVLLTARAECFLVGHADPLAEASRRLEAYAAAGADVLFAPGVSGPAEIRALVQSVHPKPLNVLIGADNGLRVGDLAELGVRRVSVGSALARVAWGAFLKAARRIAQEGEFSGFAGAASFGELNSMLGEARPARGR